MKEIKKNDLTIKLKSEGLTAGQVGNLVKEAVRIYKEGGLFDDYAFNPVDMEINFYAGLFYLVIEDYDIENNDELEKMFTAGIHKELLKEVENAQLAYDLMWKTANEVSDSIGMVLNKIKVFMDNLPENEKLDELMEKLPEEWKTVKQEYDNIIGNKIEGEKE